MLRRDLHAANRLSWNAATVAHNSHKRDQAAFLKGGGSTLFPEECELLGELAGKRLLHLLCNCGPDTLSLAARGAEVTGVDIGDEAIAYAERLSAESGLPGRFVRADVFEWLEAAAAQKERFDLVFCSYGALCWISDMDLFARQVAALLVPGGRFVAMEFHPYAMVFNEKFLPGYSYFQDEPYCWDEGVNDYVGRAAGALSPSGHQEGVKDFKNPHPVHEFLRGLGSIVTAFSRAGLSILELREYPYANGCDFIGGLVETEGRRFRPPEGVGRLALMYGLVAQRPINGAGQ